MLDERQRRDYRRNVQRHAAVGRLILACLSWGLSTALTKIVLDQLTPVDLFGVEILVSAIPLAFLAFARGVRPSRPDPLLLVLGVLEPGLTYVLFDVGVQRTTASHAALLLALDSPATLVLAVMFLRERIDLPLLTSLVLGFGGSVLVTWHSDGAAGSVIGDALVIGSSLTAAGYGVLARRVAPGRDPVIVTAVQMLGALMIAVPIFCDVSRPRRQSSRERRPFPPRASHDGRATRRHHPVPAVQQRHHRTDCVTRRPHRRPSSSCRRRGVDRAVR